ncbi:hypothetical protein PR202_gb08536 [Eleusine coracana subsp. coracana]|uniref:Glycosyltransferase n=1 Tax=Eleusine coracana subsp. coracana TaxID=191504 RepID=A0AAV5ECD8_ELECO|nr:hypothetical protein QOZ80_2BG0186500 [Eleusine coracana subsp. coracana]GJN21088.1 hypothetical protein PR202_gb08536 [Eleusine coracana subsp. coracana]
MSTARGHGDEGEEVAAAHAVFFPFPAQGHVAAALHLARLLHVHHGARVTFVHSERNRRRILRSRGPAALAGAPGFRFAAVPDGLPPSSDEDAEDDHSPEHIAALLAFIDASVPHLRAVLDSAAASGAPATCVVSDIASVLRASGQELMGVPAVAFWTTGACGLWSNMLCQQLIEKGLVPLKGNEQLRNGYLDTVVDWAPGMPRDMRLRDFVSFVRTTDADDGMLRAVMGIMDTLRTAPSALILNTFDELEAQVLAAMRPILPPIYTVGPLPLLAAEQQAPLATLSASLSKEDGGCLAWLGRKPPRSVVYANFGSIAVLTTHQLREFAWGLARSGHDFLLVVRNDQAKDDACGGGGPAAAAEGRGYVASWCPQAEVLRHEAVGAFLTHCGWNSVLEGVCSGVPLLCWPFAADQQTNCRFACTEWRVGVEVAADVDSTEVAELVREVMAGERGREMRQRAAEWKEKAAAAAALRGGSAWVNLHRLVNQVFRRHRGMTLDTGVILSTTTMDKSTQRLD